MAAAVAVAGTLLTIATGTYIYYINRVRAKTGDVAGTPKRVPSPQANPAPNAAPGAAAGGSGDCDNPPRAGNDPNRLPQSPKPGAGGKAGATDVPSWVRNTGYVPYEGESGNQFAKRVMDDYWGEGCWSGVGPDSDYNKIKKYGDRHFE